MAIAWLAANMEDFSRNFPEDEINLDMLPNFVLPFEALLSDTQPNVAEGETNFSQNSIQR